MKRRRSSPATGGKPLSLTASALSRNRCTNPSTSNSATTPPSSSTRAPASASAAVSSVVETSIAGSVAGAVLVALLLGPVDGVLLMSGASVRVLLLQRNDAPDDLSALPLDHAWRQAVMHLFDGTGTTFPPIHVGVELVVRESAQISNL